MEMVCESSQDVASGTSPQISRFWPAKPASEKRMIWEGVTQQRSATIPHRTVLHRAPASQPSPAPPRSLYLAGSRVDLLEALLVFLL